MVEQIGTGRLAFLFAALWCLLNIAGHYGIAGHPKLYSSTCFRFVGCNDGFFGPDAFIHFLSGVAVIFIAAWIFSRYFSSNPASKTLFIALLISAGMSISWEFFEFGSDWVRMSIFNIDLRGMDRLAQPSFIDTVGDVVFGIAGSLFAATALLIGRRK